MTDAARLASIRLSLRYPGTPAAAVEEASLDVADRQITTIIGPNGCGKSTLLRGLGRLLGPESGSVVLDGELIHRMPAKTVARRMGILGQQPSAPQGITVHDLAHRGRYPHLGFFSAPASEDDHAVERALELAGVRELRHSDIDALSGGQRQRAWIAMALAQDTDVLLLDEPTTFLDMAHQLEVMDLVRRLRTEGKTILMVLHDLNQAVAVSDHLVAMRDSRIIRSGSPAEIIDRDLLKGLYEVDCDVFSHPLSGRPVCVPYGGESTSPVEWGKRPVIEARTLSTGYDRATVVSRGLEVSVPGGAITTVIGPNGCGKSTLLRTSARLLEPIGGKVMLGGSDVRSGSRKELARRLSMVIQGPNPPTGFLVEDVVAAGRIPHQRPFRRWSAADDAAITEAIETCGLGELRFREFETLSGGQMQRTWIAMALAQDADVMLLDEPTTFLDVGYQVEVLDLVYRLNREEGHTVVMILHDLNLASRYSDHLIVMNEGEVVASGAPDVVVDEALVSEVFGVDSRVVPDRRTGRPVVLPMRVSPPVGDRPDALVGGDRIP